MTIIPNKKQSAPNIQMQLHIKLSQGIITEKQSFNSLKDQVGLILSEKSSSNAILI